MASLRRFHQSKLGELKSPPGLDQLYFEFGLMGQAYECLKKLKTTNSFGLRQKIFSLVTYQPKILPTLIVPVPQRASTLNKSLSIFLGQKLSAPAIDLLIKRPSNTVKLALMGRLERMLNPPQFEIFRTDFLEGKDVLIVDDFCTTGATLKSLVKDFESYPIRSLSLYTLGLRVSLTTLEETEKLTVLHPSQT